MRANKIIVAVIAVVIAACALIIFCKPAQAFQKESWEWKTEPSDITNQRVLDEMQMERFQAWYQEGKQLIFDKVAEIQAEQQAAEEAAYYASQQAVYAPSYGGVRGDPNGLNSFVGVVDYNGTTETAYSSNVLYHYRTSEWTPDEYGFYRTSDGYYVVASNDYEQGTVIETSRGEAMVLDGGCNSGWVDFYTNW